MYTKQEHINAVNEEIKEIVAECKQNFQKCKTYGLEIEETSYVKVDTMHYARIHWADMDADQLDVMSVELQDMLTALQGAINSIQALAYKRHELEDIDEYEHADD